MTASQDNEAPIEEIIGWKWIKQELTDEGGIRAQNVWKTPSGEYREPTNSVKVDDLLAWLRTTEHRNVVFTSCQSESQLSSFPEHWCSVSGYYKDNQYSWLPHGETMLEALTLAVREADAS